MLRDSLEKLQTRVLIQTKLLQLVLPSKVLFLLVMSKMYFYWMLHRYLLVLKQWAESSPDLSTETPLFQLKNLKSSLPLPIIRPRSASLCCKVREKWLPITRSLEILSFQESQWHQEVPHKSRSHSISMQMVF